MKKLAQGEISGKIARASFWLLSGSVISRGLNLVSSIIIARILGKTQFGEFSIIQSTINMFAVFAGFGLGITSTKYVAEYKNTNPHKVGNIIVSSNIIAIILGFVVAIIFFISAPIIAVNAINAPHLVTEIKIGSVILLFSALTGAQTGALAGFEDFKLIAIINIISTLIYFPIQIVCTYLWGLPGSIIGFGFQFILCSVLNHFALRNILNQYNIQIRLRDSFKDVSYLWEFSFPALLAIILVAPATWICNTFLVNGLNGMNEMAIYNAASQWQNIVLFIPMTIAQISLPLFISNKNDRGKLIKSIKYNILINLFVGLSIAIVFSLGAKWIMKSYGGDFIDGRVVLILLSFAAVLNAVNSVLGQVIASLGKMWLGFVTNMLWGVAVVGFSYYFTNKNYGAKGLALSMFLAYIFHTFNVSILALYLFNNKAYKQKIK